MPNQEPFFAMAGGMPFPPPPQHHRPGELPPGFHPFMPGVSLGGPGPQQALQAQAALLSRNMLPQLPSQGPQENMLEKYGNMLRQLQGLQKEENNRKRSPSPPVQEHRRLHSPLNQGLNLSYKSEEEKEVGTDDMSSDKSESELADIDGDTIDDNISDENSMDCGDRYMFHTASLLCYLPFGSSLTRLNDRCHNLSHHLHKPLGRRSA